MVAAVCLSRLFSNTNTVQKDTKRDGEEMGCQQVKGMVMEDPRRRGGTATTTTTTTGASNSSSSAPRENGSGSAATSRHRTYTELRRALCHEDGTPRDPTASPAHLRDTLLFAKVHPPVLLLLLCLLSLASHPPACRCACRTPSARWPSR